MTKKKSSLRKPPESIDVIVGNVNDLKQAMNKGSDLSCALIGGAWIETILMSLIEHFLVDCEEAKALFDIRGELDSLSKCNRMAYCLGLIATSTYKNIKVIGRIRNTFAHSQSPINFANKNVVEDCDELDVKEDEDNPKLARDKFRSAVYTTWVTILVRIPKIKHRAPLPERGVATKA
jgi:hypothetical protein